MTTLPFALIKRTFSHTGEPIDKVVRRSDCYGDLEDEANKRNSRPGADHEYLVIEEETDEC